MLKCTCGFTCERKFSMDRHRKSSKHEQNLASLECVAVNGVYACKKCDYFSPLKSNFRRHILSNSHKLKETEEIEAAPKPVFLVEVIDMFMKHHESTLKHQETTQLQNNEMLMKHLCHQENTQIQNTEMFKALAERIVACQQYTQQHQIHSGLMNQNNILHNTTTTTTTTTMNSNNKKFNLNLF